MIWRYTLATTLFVFLFCLTIFIGSCFLLTDYKGESNIMLLFLNVIMLPLFFFTGVILYKMIKRKTTVIEEPANFYPTLKNTRKRKLKKINKIK